MLKFFMSSFLSVLLSLNFPSLFSLSLFYSLSNILFFFPSLPSLSLLCFRASEGGRRIRSRGGGRVERGLLLVGRRIFRVIDDVFSFLVLSFCFFFIYSSFSFCFCDQSRWNSYQSPSLLFDAATKRQVDSKYNERKEKEKRREPSTIIICSRSIFTLENTIKTESTPPENRVSRNSKLGSNQ